jgi:uncharacterized protein YjdB/alpha-tubulin suppressor-like RCC1 family protein
MLARTKFYRVEVLRAKLTILASCLLAAVSCRDSTRAVGARSVTIVRESGFIREIGDVMQLRAEAVGADGSAIAGSAVVWTSSDSSVVAVSPGGLLTARGYGAAVVTARVDDAKATYDVTVPKITSVSAPDKVEVGIGDTTLLRATVTYSDGPAGWSHGATWTVRDTSLVAVDTSGRVFGKGRVGNTIVVASIKGFVDSTLVVVWNPGFYVWPDTSLVPAGATRELRVQQFATSSGVHTLSGAAWSSSDPAVAIVDASGLVTAGQAGHATIVATRDGQRAVAEVYVPSYDHRFRFSSVNAEISSTCALDNGAEYCWGDLGEMLDGMPHADRCEVISRLPKGGVSRAWKRCAGSPVAVPTTLRFATLAKGQLALTADGTLYLFTPSGPKEAAPGYHFRQTSGGWQICGVALDDTGYCWGSNWDGLLGTGTAQELGPYPTTPQRVSGDIRWSMIEISSQSTCGLSVGGKAYCWGPNRNFRLGVGPDSTTRAGCTGACVLVPTAVLTDAVFTTMASRMFDTCALTADGSAYCWGVTSAALPPSAAGVPVLVRAAPVLRSLTTTAESDICGASDDGGVYCLRRDPAATDPSALYSFVRQPLPFAVRGLTMGGASSCAFAVSDGRLYCWGTGSLGRLGDGRFMDVPIESPTSVANQ